MSKDFLLEIGTEEIPSEYLGPALKAMEEQWLDLLERSRIDPGTLEALGTPRRMVLIAGGMAERQSEVETRTMGPPESVAFDDEGKPTRAALGFAKKCGVAVEELSIEDTDRGKYVCAVRVDEGEETLHLLPSLMPELMARIPFPKSMRWGDGDTRFVRPVHWLVCLYGEDTVKFEFGGITCGNCSRGHRFMSPDTFPVRAPDSYLAQAEERFVMVDQKARKVAVRGMVEELAAEHGGEPYRDDGLLERVVNLVEYPVGVWGGFEEKYLELPREVLITSMVNHQRYFPVQRIDGSLMPNFITLSNTPAKDLRVVAHGNEKVLRARLADAMFFFKEDTATPLDGFVAKLKKVVYQEKLGTSYQKMERFRELALALCSLLEVESGEVVERAAYLCKADLMTQMVDEFPSLQGVMGREYALLSGEKEEVAAAIYEHYLPRYSGDGLPETQAGAVLSLADRLDTIVGSFGIGVKPTGNVDPHGLRRQAIGIINIISDNGFRLSLRDAVGKAVEILGDKATEDPHEVKAGVLDFFARRVENLYLAEGYRYDLVDSAMGAGFSDLVELKLRLEALTEFSQRSDFEALTTTFKRVVNIIPSEGQGSVDTSLFQEEAERILYSRVNDAGRKIVEQLHNELYVDALAGIAHLRESVDSFFDNVLVMADDEGIRRNRLALLDRVAGLFSDMADFSKIVVGK